MKKLILILVMIILNFTACSNKNSIEASYIKIDNKNLLFGDKKSKNKFQFTEKENGHISKNLIIYFNNDDFKSESMDLCRKTGEYDLLKNVKEDSNGNKYPTFEKNKIVLNSNGEAKRDFIYMGDVATIVDKVLKIEATNEIYNLSSNQTFTI